MKNKVAAMPEGFPLAPIDAAGQHLQVGDQVFVLSVESCARNLPDSDQQHLQTLIGARREIMEFDPYGFVWLSFTAEDKKADFCLFPTEVRKQ